MKRHGMRVAIVAAVLTIGLCALGGTAHASELGKTADAVKTGWSGQVYYWRAGTC